MELNELRKIHIESWDVLKEELDLGSPFWIELNNNNLIQLPNGKLIDLKSSYNIRFIENQEIGSECLFDLDSLRNEHIVAYYLGTYIHPEAQKKYPKKSLRVRLIHENFHNCFAEANPYFHTIHNVWEHFVKNKVLRSWGEYMDAFEEQYSCYLMYNQPERFGITREDLISDLALASWYKGDPKVISNYIKMSNEMFEGSSLREVMKDPWYFIGRYNLDSYSTLCEIEVVYNLMIKKIKEIWKRQIDGSWKRLV